MISSSKRLLVLVPVLVLIAVVSTSSVDRESLLFELCNTQGSAVQSTQCAVVADTLNWFAGSAAKLIGMSVLPSTATSWNKPSGGERK